MILKKQKSKKKQNKKIHIISNVILFIYLIISLFLLGIIIKLSVLPLKYILMILPIYALFTLLFSFSIIKKNIKSGIKIFIDVILSILIIIYSAGLIYLNKALNFMDKIRAKDYQIEEYYVLVLKDSKYENVSEIKEIGIYEFDDNYKTALEELNKKSNFTEKKYNNYNDAVNNLLNKKIEAVFISSSHKSILEEQVDFDKIKILDTTEIKIKNEVTIEDIDVTKESFNIYISGIDIYGDISQVSRSDVNMIATINPVTHQVLLTSIPRDYYVKLHNTTGYKDKLTHAGLYGINMSIETLEDLFEIDIYYFIDYNNIIEKGIKKNLK